MQIEASTDPAHTQREETCFLLIAAPQIGYSVMTKGLDPKYILGPFPAVNAQERLEKLVREIVLLVYQGNPPIRTPIPLFGVASALCRTPATHRPRLQDRA